MTKNNRLCLVAGKMKLHKPVWEYFKCMHFNKNYTSKHMLAEAALILLLDYQRKTPGRNSISCPAFRATVGISTKGSKIHLMKTTQS